MKEEGSRANESSAFIFILPPFLSALCAKSLSCSTSLGETLPLGPLPSVPEAWAFTMRGAPGGWHMPGPGRERPAPKALS